MNEQEPQKPRRVLIVEDELIIAADLEISLRDLGFIILGAVGNAGEAIARVSKDPPDIVLMDIQLLGEPEGLRAAETIRKNRNIPVVFLTSCTTEEMMLRARGAGASGFLTRPFRLEDLNATLRIALQQHQAVLDLFAERHWLVMMLASVSDGVIAADDRGCVRYLNSAAEKMTRWTPAEALGKPIEEVFPIKYMDGTPVAECQLRRALAAKAPIPKERFLMHIEGGSGLPVEYAAAPIIEEGHLIGAVSIFLDITAQLEAEERQRQEHMRLETEVQQTGLVLGQKRAELRALTHRLLTAQEEDRRRIARDLHDDLGQRVALMAWRAQKVIAQSTSLPRKIQDDIGALQQELNDLSAALRKTSHQLHPAIIADLGLEAALRELAESQRQRDIDVSFVAHDVPASITNEVSVTLYRIAQEAMRNAMRHAPGAPILIKLATSEDHLQLSVEDAGPGFDLDKVRRTRGLGLLSLQERALAIGGILSINAVPGEGASIAVRIPIALVTAPSSTPPDPTGAAY